MEQLLDDCPVDLRGWEWRYLKRLRYGALSPLRYESPVNRVAFSPDGRYLASADTDRTVIVWDVAHRTRLATLTDHEDAMSTGVAFSPDGRTLAYTSADHTVVLWDVAHRTVTARLAGHSQPVKAVAFSPDGTTVATTGFDRSVIVWTLDPQRIATDICHALARDLTPERWRHFLPDVPYARTCT